jgi:hypothetical protein
MAKTIIRVGTLSRVFSVPADRGMHALMASLCVLFEDLRIELAGQMEKDLGGMDECSKEWRYLYFLRRSFVTLHEFSQMIQELDRLPAFQRIKAGFDSEVLKAWSSSVMFFRKHDSYIARLRNNVGGHFGKKAAKVAIDNLMPDATGSLEVLFTEKGGGAKLFFAHEIVATGALAHVPGANIRAKSRRLVLHALVAYRKATRAVDCIAVSYLWDRFGRG